MKLHLEKFDPFDGSADYTFPLKAYEYEPTQETRSLRVQTIGNDYAFRLRGTERALRDVGRERVRCLFTGNEAAQDTAWDAARVLVGKFGKLWLLDSDGSTRRWAWAECVGTPEITVSYGQPEHLPLVFAFDRLSDWFAENPVAASNTMNSNAETFVVNNPGNLPATRMTMRLRANGSFNRPLIMNNTNGSVLHTSRTSLGTGSEVRLDTRRPAIEFTNDDGVLYIDDFANYLLPGSGQKALSFRLEPGNNTIQANLATPLLVSATLGGTVSSGTSLPVKMPNDIRGGDRIAVVITAGSTPDFTPPSPFGTVSETSNTIRLSLYALTDGFATGAEAGKTYTFVAASSVSAEAYVLVVRGSKAMASGTPATGSSTTPDPPSVTFPSGSRNALAITAIQNAAGGVNAVPGSYTALTPTSKLAQRNVTTSPENPGTYTLSASGAWVAQTLIFEAVDTPNFDLEFSFDAPFA